MSKLPLSVFLFAFLVAGAAQASDGQDRRIMVRNWASVPLVELHASNVSQGIWEEDVLGDRILSPGQQVVFDAYDGTRHCHFDFLGVFADGSTATRYDMNVCTGLALNFTN